MMVYICVGSACHLKGSYDIISLMKKAISEHNLESDIDLKGMFCLGKCGIAGVTIKVDDQIITGVNPENFEQIFKENILDVLGK